MNTNNVRLNTDNVCYCGKQKDDKELMCDACTTALEDLISPVCKHCTEDVNKLRRQ